MNKKITYTRKFVTPAPVAPLPIVESQTTTKKVKAKKSRVERLMDEMNIAA